jgi:YfiH family protein
MLLSCHDGSRAPDDAVIADQAGGARVLFLGRRALSHRVEPAAALERARALHARLPATLLHNRQCHSARVVEAGAVPASADGLFTSRSDVALAVFTADCVPVLLAAPGAVAALHAGWRGLAASIVRTGARALVARCGGAAQSVVAWIGPCIGGCCYEVSEEVAERVAAAGAPGAVIPRSPRPHLELAFAAREQLAAAGVENVRWLRHCTSCAPDHWWSHRREAGRAARNYALVWRSPAESS